MISDLGFFIRPTQQSALSPATKSQKPSVEHFVGLAQGPGGQVLRKDPGTWERNRLLLWSHVSTNWFKLISTGWAEYFKHSTTKDFKTRWEQVGTGMGFECLGPSYLSFPASWLHPSRAPERSTSGHSPRPSSGFHLKPTLATNFRSLN